MFLKSPCVHPEPIYYIMESGIIPAFTIILIIVNAGI